jgi:Tfp pilus assembly protein PilX
MKSHRGITLILILAIILAVVFLANIALVLIRSQFRLTHHQVSRIQAFYAAQAGTNYALEKLRTNDPDWTTPGTHRLCRGCTAVGDINEPDLPYSIQYVDITVGAPGSGIGPTREITATARYTFQ